MSRPRSTKICSKEGCGRKYHARGMCRPHYASWWWVTTKGTSLDPSKPIKLCEVPGCKRRYWARGKCCLHYHRMRDRLGLNNRNKRDA